MPYVPAPALSGDIDCDVAIIGGGFTGVSTAYHLARRFPGRRIVLCEARSIGSGASGQNGGLVLNWINGVSTRDLAMARRVFDTTRSGIDAIEQRIREHALPVPFRRTGALELFTDGRRADAAAREVERLRSVGIPVEFLFGRELERVVRLKGARGAILDPLAGHLDGVAFLQSQRALLSELGVHVYEGTPVLGVAEGEVHTLAVPGGRVRAKAIVLATNAYTPQLGFFRSGVIALHSYVIATEPLGAALWASMGWPSAIAGFSDDRARTAYASMTSDGELVCGGGSNAAYGYGLGERHAFHGSATGSYRAIQDTLEEYLPAVRAARVRIDHRWAGPIALTLSRICTMGVQGQHRNVFYALGYSGHGITLANLAGEVLTDLYSGDDSRWRGLPFLQQRLLRIPPEPLRWMGYQLYTRVTGRTPRRSL